MKLSNIVLFSTLFCCQLMCATYKFELASKLQSYQSRQRLMQNTSGYLAVGEILREIEVLPLHFTEEQFHKWFQAVFLGGRRDVFFRYPNLDTKTLKELCAFAKVESVPLPTYIDVKYSEFTRWRASLSPYGLDMQIALELDELFFTEGSRGDFKTIQIWVREHLDAKDLNEKTLAALSQIADLTDYESLKQRLSHLRAWQNQLSTNPHTPLYALSERIAEEMETILLFSGGSDEFDAWVLSSFGGSKSLYFQYPGIEQPELEQLFAEIGLPKPLGPAPVNLNSGFAIE